MPPNRLAGYNTATVLLAALLSGCAVGPDFVRPTAPPDSGYAVMPVPDATASDPDRDMAAQRFIDGQDIAFDWWTSFGSAPLDQLVDQALHSNPSIAAAEATLRQAQELVYAQQGFFLPSIGGDYTFERQQLAGNLGSNAPGPQGNGAVILPAAPAKPTIYNLHTAQLSVSYAPDVLGANRRQVESLEAQAESQRYLLQATYVSLIDNVVAAAVLDAGLRDQIKATNAIIAANSKTVAILKAQLKAGYAMGIDLATTESALAQAEQLLPPLQKQLAQTQDLLRALTGALPNQEVPEIASLADLKLPATLPRSLPSKIIEQRPDVRAAEELVRSANANVGVAIAARLPQFAISGSAGGVAAQFGQMFKDGGPFWTIIGDVSMPLFDGNTLLHRERAADQALIQANLQYRSTVIAAYQNVADSLHAITTDADALKAAIESERAAKVVLDLTRRQNQLGYVDWLTWYAAEITYQQAVLNRIQAQAARLSDTAALFQALGGGWWNRTTLAADNTAGDPLLDLLP